MRLQSPDQRYCTFGLLNLYCWQLQAIAHTIVPHQKLDYASLSGLVPALLPKGPLSDLPKQIFCSLGRYHIHCMLLTFTSTLTTTCDSDSLFSARFPLSLLAHLLGNIDSAFGAGGFRSLSTQS